MIRLWPFVLLCLVFATPLRAQEGGEAARAAGIALAQAGQQLARADKARDRVKALAEALQAYEAGLSAMRTGLRAAALREEQLSRKLAARDGEIALLIGALQSIGTGPSPTVLLHPQGPTGTARAGMMLAELTPVLNARAADLRQDLSDVQNLRDLQQQAADQMQLGLSEVQRARVALNRAMAERTDLPQRFVEDPVKTAILIASTQTLEAFAAGLDRVASQDKGAELPALEARIGTLPLPAIGLVLRGAGEADAAGITRPGMLLATSPGALVRTPAAATIRYVGPLLDYGKVVILEPRDGTLFVFAGLGGTYGAIGQVIGQGTPVGLMGGLEMLPATEAGDASPSIDGEGGGNARSETLYIEVRQENVPQDPATWFRTDKDR